MDAYDVIIVGTGAGGGTLARRLASSGKRILLLERGDWLPREPENWLAQNVFVENRYVSEDTWYDASGKPFQPQIHYFVGGATKLYGAALYRLRKEDFGELRHHDGVSPAWPISYDELEPYYTQAEQLYEVHGTRGEDPTEPPASAPYPFPAVSHEPRIQQLADDLAAAGYHPFHAPCGVRLDESNLPYSHCVRCTNCDGFPCAVHGKSDAEVLGVRPALEHENVTLLTNARAVRLETSDVGHDRDRGRGRARRRDGALRRRRLRRRLRRGEHGASCCSARRTTSIRTASPTARTRSAATTCSTTARPCSRSRARRTRRSSRRRSGSTTSTSRSDEFEYPLGNIQMVGKSQARDVPRREAGRDEARAGVDARAGREARDRLLALDRGPAAAGQPRHGRQGRQADAQLHGRRTRSRSSSCTRSCGRSSASST